MQHPESKILSLEEALQVRNACKEKKLKVVFTNGCFDILHKGHAAYLYEARNLGDFLLVGLNSDTSVKLQNKSISRPLQDETSRALLLASFAFVDAVVLFNEETPFHLIDTLLPDILVKGGDYKVEEIVGYNEVVGNGGKVVTIDFIPGYSTSAIENKIIADRCL
jgi:rfaE bifunctional protein nucleotidyltransferase chain/domain